MDAWAMRGSSWLHSVEPAFKIARSSRSNFDGSRIRFRQQLLATSHLELQENVQSVCVIAPQRRHARDPGDALPGCRRLRSFCSSSHFTRCRGRRHGRPARSEMPATAMPGSNFSEPPGSQPRHPVAARGLASVAEFA